jgi:hypothetical protein
LKTLGQIGPRAAEERVNRKKLLLLLLGSSLTVCQR